MHPHPTAASGKGHKRQKSSVLSANFHLPDQENELLPPIYSYPTHLIPAVYNLPKQRPLSTSRPSLRPLLPTKNRYLRHHRNNLSISSHFNTVSLEPTFDAPPNVLLVPDALSNPLVESLIKQLEVVDNSNINGYLLEVTRKLALSLPIDEFFNLLFRDNHPIENTNDKIDRSSVDDDNLQKTTKAVEQLLHFFQNPATLSKYLSTLGAHLTNINFHELQRTFLAFKILDEIIVVVPGESDSQAISIPRPFIYKVYFIICQHCIAKYPFTSDREEQQSLLLGQSKFGKLLKLAFPSVKIKRLGSRGDSKYHFLGVRWNPALVSSETLNLCEEQDISDLKFLFTDVSTKRQMAVPRSSRRRSVTVESSSVTPTTKRGSFPVPRSSAIKPSTHYFSWMQDGLVSENNELLAYIDNFYRDIDGNPSMVDNRVRSIVSSTIKSTNLQFFSSQVEKLLSNENSDDDKKTYATYLSLLLHVGLDNAELTESETKHITNNVKYLLTSGFMSDITTSRRDDRVFRSALRHWLHMTESLNSLAAKLASSDSVCDHIAELLNERESTNAVLQFNVRDLASRSLVKVLLAYEYLPSECQDFDTDQVQEFAATRSSVVFEFFTELESLRGIEKQAQMQNLLKSAGSHFMSSSLTQHLPVRVIIDFVRTFFMDVQSEFRFAQQQRVKADTVWAIGTFVHELLSYMGEITALIDLLNLASA